MHQPNGDSRPVSARKPKDDSTQPLMSSPTHSKSTEDGQFGKFFMILYLSYILYKVVVWIYDQCYDASL